MSCRIISCLATVCQNQSSKTHNQDKDQNEPSYPPEMNQFSDLLLETKNKGLSAEHHTSK